MKLLLKLIIPLLLLAACSDLKDNIVDPITNVHVHKEGVNKKTSDNFHGELVKSSDKKLKNCQSCHASDYSGNKTGVDCSNCHPSIAVHNGNTTMISHRNFVKESDGNMAQCQECHADDFSGGVASPACSNCHQGIAVHSKDKTMIYHREFIKNSEGNMAQCQDCHADDFSGGLTSPSCVTCHSSIQVHEKDKPMNYHKDFIKASNEGMDQCMQCHGDDYGGGEASPTCAKCHTEIAVHAKGTNAYGHISYLKNHNWQMQSCNMCHGDDYSGGAVSPTCLTCHTKENGPENCSTCHFDNNYEPADSFHKKHLEAVNGRKVLCSDCHKVPSDVNDDGHLDGNPGVELIFGGVAITATNEPGTEGYVPEWPTLTPNPVYSKANASCSDVYCHGFFKNGNTETPVQMNQVFKCGTCHGDPATGDPLPKGTHPKLTNCSLCHSTVDSDRNIVKPNQHINGILNVYNQERDY